MRAARIVGSLRTQGHEVVELTGTSADESSSALHAAVANAELDHLVVAGGDGLVNLAIQAVATTLIPVTIAPTGTGNDFATAIGIGPTDTVDLAAATTALDLIRISTGDGDIRWVASIAIAGFPAAINRRANELQRPSGPQKYTVAAALELPKFVRQVIELRIDDYPITTDSAMLAIGNTMLFGGGMLACPDATPTDGLLHLTSIQGVGRLGILRHLISRKGGTADRPEVLRRSGVQIDIDTPDLELWGDGEFVGVGPLSLRSIPGALHVGGIGSA